MNLPAHFELTFNTSSGRARTIRVNNANTSGLTATTVRNAMTSIVNANALMNAAGTAVSPRRAFLIQQSQTPIVMPI